MTQYEYLKNQEEKLAEAYKNSEKPWIANKLCEMQKKIRALTIEEAGSDYRPPRR